MSVMSLPRFTQAADEEIAGILKLSTQFTGQKGVPVLEIKTTCPSLNWSFFALGMVSFKLAGENSMSFI